MEVLLAVGADEVAEAEVGTKVCTDEVVAAEDTSMDEESQSSSSSSSSSEVEVVLTAGAEEVATGWDT